MEDTTLRRTQERRVRREGEKLQDIADQIKKPSLLWFLFVLLVVVIAEIIDIIDAIAWISAFLTAGATAPAPLLSSETSTIVDAVVLVVLMMSGYISSRHLKKAHEYRENIGKSIQLMEKRIATLRQNYVFALKAGRKIKILRRPLAKVALKFRAAKLLSTKNPTVRYLLRTLGDLVPILSAWPFRTIAVIKTYKEEKLAYEHREEMHDYWMMANAAEVLEEEQLMEEQGELEEEQEAEVLEREESEFAAQRRRFEGTSNREPQPEQSGTSLPEADNEEEKQKAA